jgi:hypothetical protein
MHRSEAGRKHEAMTMCPHQRHRSHPIPILQEHERLGEAPMPTCSTETFSIFIIDTHIYIYSKTIMFPYKITILYPSPPFPRPKPTSHLHRAAPCPSCVAPHANPVRCTTPTSSHAPRCAPRCSTPTGRAEPCAALHRVRVQVGRVRSIRKMYCGNPPTHIMSAGLFAARPQPANKPQTQIAAKQHTEDH